MQVSKTFVQRFHKLRVDRDFAGAERELESLRGRLAKAEWGRGYLAALEGMLTAYRNRNDKYALINRFPSGKEEIAPLLEEFRLRSKSYVSSDYDKGFFHAWADFAQLVAEGLIEVEKLSEAKEELESPAS